MRLALTVLALLALPSAAAAQANPRQAPTDYTPLYTKREAMIPMRDGVRLYTAIYAPRDTMARHPILMTRTPYSSWPYGADRFPGFFRNPSIPPFRSYLRNGYIFVFQDVRGRFMSEGDFVDVRPYIERKRSKRDVDESSDAWDTVDWLVHNVPGNNGRLGVRGTSYPGFYSSMTAIDAHPAVKAVAPQAPVTEWMGGDDFFHNGAFLLPHAFDFFARTGWPRPAPTAEFSRAFDHGAPDGYDFFLNRLGALRNANPRFFHDSVAFWNQLAQHPAWDAFWQARSVRPWLRDLRPAMLWVGGWFDTENLWGALHAYAAAEQHSPGASNRLVMGPWSHGQWSNNRADSLGALAWGSATGVFYHDSIEAPFFDHYLLGEGKPPVCEAEVFETGADRWHCHVFPDSGAGGPPAARSRLGNYQMLVRGDVLRGKYRNSMSKPERFTPDAPTPIKFRLNDSFHTFRAGHRLMVQVQSSWFPMIDRNPGRFMDIWQATDGDFQPTTQRVYRSAAEPSRLVLPVLR